MKRWAPALALLATLATAGAAVAGWSGGSGDGDDGFLLGGTAQHAQDPENPANDVIRVDSTPAAGDCVPPTYLNCPVGAVSRKLGVEIHELDNMLETKYYFVTRTCNGGSPRFQLAVDTDGDGEPDGNAFGYLGNVAFGGGCPPGVWTYEDMTNETPKWDLSQFGGPMTNTWSMVEAFFSAYPDHVVCSGTLIDDSGWSPAASGVAYFDVVSIGRATWEDRGDTAGRGFVRGCARPDGKDGHHHGGDHDRDGDEDDDDGRWKDRRDRWGDH